jgi:hypothetical protein
MGNKPLRQPHGIGKTARRLTRAALFGAVRGMGYAVGSASITLLSWWLHHR